MCMCMCMHMYMSCHTYTRCVFKFEFTPGGTVLPQYSFKMLKFFLWEGVSDMASALDSPQVYTHIYI